MKTYLFMYFTKLWALAVGITVAFLFLHQFIKGDIPIGSMSLGTLKMTGVLILGGFLLSGPALMVYAICVQIVLALKIDYPFKKMLLAAVFAGLIILTGFALADKPDYETNLVILTGTIAAALAVIILKLPIEDSTNEGTI